MTDALATAIKAAEGEVAALRDQLAAAVERRDALYLDRSKQEYGIEAGLLVEYKGAVYRVVRVKPESWSTKPWVYGNKRLAGGSWGARDRLLFSDWQIIAKESAA